MANAATEAFASDRDVHTLRLIPLGAAARLGVTPTDRLKLLYYNVRATVRKMSSASMVWDSLADEISDPDTGWQLLALNLFLLAGGWAALRVL